MQIVLAARVLITTSIRVSIDTPQNDISGDIKEFRNWNNAPCDINLWDDEW